MKTVRIVLAEDHNIVREGLRTLLHAQDGFQVVGEAENGRDAVVLVEQLKPDVLVVDMMMPGLRGTDVTYDVKARFPEIAVVVLSMHDNESFVVEALRAGASAYLLKRSTGDELVHAIQEVMSGRRYLYPALSEQLIDTYVQKIEFESLDPYETLTFREREVFNLVAEGYSNKDVAERLSLSIRTVERHRGNVMRKLQIESHTDLVRYAIQKGIIPLE